MNSNSPSKTTSKGEFLKKVRESKGISLQTIHEATKIPLDALKAIEEGYTIRSLSTFYLRGFLKIYAQYLDINVSEVLEDFKEEKLPPKQIKPKVAEFDTRDVKETFTRFFNAERRQNLKKLIGIIIVLFLFIGFVKAMAMKRRENAPARIVKQKEPRKIQAPQDTQKTKKVSPPPSAAAKSEPVPAEASAPTPVETTTEVKSPVPSGKKISLTVRAKRGIWLQVKADGTVVFQSTLKQGVAETWTAETKIEISGKNMGELDFELNGKAIGSLGKSDRMARRIVVTKEGFSVKN